MVADLLMNTTRQVVAAVAVHAPRLEDLQKCLSLHVGRLFR